MLVIHPEDIKTCQIFQCQNIYMRLSGSLADSNNCLRLFHGGSKRYINPPLFGNLSHIHATTIPGVNVGYIATDKIVPFSRIQPGEFFRREDEVEPGAAFVKIHKPNYHTDVLYINNVCEYRTAGTGGYFGDNSTIPCRIIEPMLF